jgi:hypothetical protein
MMVSNDRFSLLDEPVRGWSILNDILNEYDKMFFFEPVVAAVATEQPSPEPTAPPFHPTACIKLCQKTESLDNKGEPLLTLTGCRCLEQPMYSIGRNTKFQSET